MHIGVDSSNIRAGGGLNLLVKLLKVAQPEIHSIDCVTVWGGERTVEALPKRSWLNVQHVPFVDNNLVQRLVWQRGKLKNLIRKNLIDILFVLGGTYVGGFKPFVAASTNLLPFMPDERRRYGLSFNRIRLKFLELSQKSTFRRASGVIFYTESAKQIVSHRLGVLPGQIAVIYEGTEKRFFQIPRQQREICTYSLGKPFSWLYVSIVDVYKHQWTVADAVAKLRQRGFPISLQLIGPSYGPALARLEKVMRRVDPAHEFIHYLGPVSHRQILDYYCRADGAIFASSCETFPQIVLESMASGLPIACSNRDPMREILGDAGLYFDPEIVEQISEVLEILMNDHVLRYQLAWKAFKCAKPYTWGNCARDTFDFLVKRAKEFRTLKNV